MIVGLAAGGVAAAALDARLAPHLAGLSVLDPLTFAAVAILVVAMTHVLTSISDANRQPVLWTAGVGFADSGS